MRKTKPSFFKIFYYNDFLKVLHSSKMLNKENI